ncbi:MAG TPA: nodulation protein NfeD [Rhizomicrobium sp.]|jgi:membrane-bound serine protease (ClpP class)|nr:nodulation protein NfeD [Rhizomicrobium sp.]
MRRASASGTGTAAFCGLAAVLLSVLMITSPAAAAAGRVAVLEIDSAIGPATAEYVTQELSTLDPAQTRLVILEMNTPGGLDSAMREIIRAILSSPVPVATYVAPAGARAASAGTYIAYASAIAAMAPGTNIGAATPVQMGGLPGTMQPAGGSNPQTGGEARKGKPVPEPADTESRKIVNDAAAYIRSLAELNHRNADWAEQAVREAMSLPASQALKLHVVDLIAADIPDLLRQIDGRTVTVDGKPQRLKTTGLAIVKLAPGWRTDFLGVITDPNIAFLLMMIGFYGLIFEFLNPGMVVPGLIGGISLLVALFALSLLPIDYAGAALVALGIGLMIAEVHIGAFGVLGVGGVFAFAIGAIIMFPAGAPGFHLSGAVVGAITAATAAFFFLAVGLLLRSRRRPVVTGREALGGAEGETVVWQDGEGRVRVQGEIWRARSQRALAPGSRIRVVGHDGLVLIVEPA